MKKSKDRSKDKGNKLAGTGELYRVIVELPLLKVRNKENLSFSKLDSGHGNDGVWLDEPKEEEEDNSKEQ